MDDATKMYDYDGAGAQLTLDSEANIPLVGR
jgi:hypothetical protein